MTMRDKIAEIILTYDDTDALHLVYPDGYCEGCKDTPCIDNPDLRLTDAIIAALPEMIAPLVWEYDAGWHNAGQYEIQCWPKQVDVMWSYRSRYCREVFNDITQAKASANAHHRAKIMAAFTGEPA
jgi:hypothetical protein